MGKFFTTLTLFLLIMFFASSCSNKKNADGDNVAPDVVTTERGEVDFEKWRSAKLVWADDFEGNELDSSKWLYEYREPGVPWPNDEWQHYTRGENARVENGNLIITATLEGEGQKKFDYHSTRLNSKQSFTYGRMEVRAKMPELKGNGLWPAIWMLGENIKEIGWPRCGELDIMEYVSYEPNQIHFSVHTRDNNHMDKTHITTGAIKLETAEEEFHNYGILWDEESIHFYLDDIENIYLTINRPEEYNQDNWPFDKPHYFLLNMAVGGMWGGYMGVDDSIFPADLNIDYVRVYQL